MVVMLASFRQLLAGPIQCWEPFHVETFIAQPHVKALDEAVLDGTGRPDETQLDAGLHGPPFHHAPSKLAPVVEGDTARSRTAFRHSAPQGRGGNIQS